MQLWLACSLDPARKGCLELRGIERTSWSQHVTAGEFSLLLKLSFRRRIPCQESTSQALSDCLSYRLAGHRPFSQTSAHPPGHASLA